MIKGAHYKDLVIAKRLAKTAGRVILQYFNSTKNQLKLKNDSSIVTEADLEINRLVIEKLSLATPDYSVWGEEESLIIEGSQFTWVCDPIDGTAPFTKSLPLASFSLALVDNKGRSLLGVIYDPFADRLWEAVRGGGAYLNDRPIRVSQVQTLENAFINLEMWINRQKGISFDDPRDKLNKADAKVTSLCASVIVGGLVADGFYDALIFGQSKPEDIAALAVIVPEAGGRVTDLFGQSQRYDRPIRGAIVSNGSIHADLLAIIKTINYRQEKSDNF